MSTQKPPLTAAEHIDQANSYLHEGGSPTHAIAHALIAIAELMAANMTETVIDAVGRGAMATAEAIGSVFSITNPAAGPAAPGPSVNVTRPCDVKSAGNRSCIYSLGHGGWHQDQDGWRWTSAGENAYLWNNPDGSCAGCGVPDGGVHKCDCRVYLARLRSDHR